MSAPLSQKETKLLLRALRLQGAVLDRIKKGYLVKFPDGATTTIHLTNSDHRSTLNMRAEIKRHGLKWPFDHERNEKDMGKMIAPERRAALNRAIEAVGEGSISAAELARLSEVSDPTAMTALKRAGFIQIKRGSWIRSVSKPVYAQPEAEAAFPEIDEPAYPEIEKARTLAPVAAPVPVVAPPKAQERHFLDEADSWTVPVPRKLQAMADLMGLNIEVRVWKKD